MYVVSNVFLYVINIQGPPGHKGDQGATEIIDYNGNIQEALQVRQVVTSHLISIVTVTSICVLTSQLNMYNSYVQPMLVFTSCNHASKGHIHKCMFLNLKLSESHLSPLIDFPHILDDS